MCVACGLCGVWRTRLCVWRVCVYGMCVWCVCVASVWCVCVCVWRVWRVCVVCGVGWGGVGVLSLQDQNKVKHLGLCHISTVNEQL